MKTTQSAKPSEIERKWFVADAEGKVLGRFASEIARILRGKHKPIFTPHIDTGDHVVIVNASKVRITGKNKLDAKVYTSYSGYPSGLKKKTLRKTLEQKPEFVLEHAVRGMLPRNKLGRQMIKKLKVYAGPDHPHKAQAPALLELA